MTDNVKGHFEGGGSFELTPECQRHIRRLAEGMRLPNEFGVTGTRQWVLDLAAALPPDPKPELDRSAWWSARKCGCSPSVLSAVNGEPGWWTVLSPGGKPWRLHWCAIAANYTDFKRLEIE